MSEGRKTKGEKRVGRRAWRVERLPPDDRDKLLNDGKQTGIRHPAFGIRFLRCFLMFIFSMAAAQSPQKALFLKSLQLNFDQRVSFPKHRFNQQYENRRYTPGLLKEIKTETLETLKTSGYYFADIAGESVEIDSSGQTVDIQLDIKNGGVLRLHSLQFENRPDSSRQLRTLWEDVAEISNDYLGKTYTDVISAALSRDILTIFENNGYPLARIHTETFDLQAAPDGKSWRLTLGLRIEPGDSVKIAYLKFPKQKNNLTPYLQRLLRFRPGQRFDANKIERYLHILRRQEFLKDVREPVLALDKNGKYFLSIDFEETPSTALDGIVGYIPPPANDRSASGYLTGLVNIGIRNLFGGGRKLKVFWQKQDRFSDEFRVGYREPFVAGLPFHTEFAMQRLVRDTTFIEWHYRLQFELPLSEALSAFVNVASRNVSPDTLASRQLRLPRTESLITETGIRWDVRDNLLNPRKGVFLEMAFGLSKQNNKGPEFLVMEDSLKRSVTLQKMRADFSVFLPTFKHQALANHFHANLIENNGGVLRLPDQVWFGGATSVRGFREAQFFARRVFWLNSEYRFLLGPQSRFFVFTDNAYFERQSPDNLKKWLTSYGLGLRLTSPLGIMQIDFGLERGAPFQEGKLHIRVINDF